MQHGYWCTWGTQNWLLKSIREDQAHRKLAFLGDQAGAGSARGMMNEATLFGTDGLLTLYPEIRKDLYFMLDDGWDVPYGAGDTIPHHVFGSLELEEARFPSIQGTPRERLRELNNRIKAAGWKGLGIWVAAQRAAEDYRTPFSEADKAYWKERILWSKFAEVRYWKVDWGTQDRSVPYRCFLTEMAQELFPELMIEHATCMIPLNGVLGKVQSGETGRFTDSPETATLAEQFAGFSQVFRTYDVLSLFSVASTLDRVAHLLPFAKGYLNVEDEPYMGAALGCQLGIMRCKYGVGRAAANSRLDEPIAAVKWQRICPPFAGTATISSEDILTDGHTYGKNETWYGPLNEKTVRQGAPAVIARNTRLPEVRAEGLKPYVVASRHPNGNFAVCALPRIVDGKSTYTGGTVICELEKKPKKIALFGKADRFGLVYRDKARVDRILAQSLLDDTEADITGAVELTDNGFYIAGGVLEALWHSQDLSAPAVVLTVRYCAES